MQRGFKKPKVNRPLSKTEIQKVKDSFKTAKQIREYRKLKKRLEADRMKKGWTNNALESMSVENTEYDVASKSSQESQGMKGNVPIEDFNPENFFENPTVDRIPIGNEDRKNSEHKISGASGLKQKEMQNSLQVKASENTGKQGKKRMSQWERLRLESEALKVKAAEEKQNKEIEIAQKQKLKQEAGKRRKKLSAKMKKVTKKGQPLMKHRMELLLEQIQKKVQ